MNPLAGLSAGLIFGGVLLGYMAGSLTVDFNSNQEINRLKNEVQKREELIKNRETDVQNHKNFIRTKDTVARRFCNEFFKGEKK